MCIQLSRALVLYAWSGRQKKYLRNFNFVGEYLTQSVMLYRNVFYNGIFFVKTLYDVISTINVE